MCLRVHAMHICAWGPLNKLRWGTASTRVLTIPHIDLDQCVYALCTRRHVCHRARDDDAWRFAWVPSDRVYTCIYWHCTLCVRVRFCVCVCVCGTSLSSSQRPDNVTVRFQTPRGERKAMKLSGFTARVFQHEFDHLDGVLFHDRYGTDWSLPSIASMCIYVCWGDRATTFCVCWYVYYAYVCVCVCVRACVLVACRMNERNLNSIRPGLVRLEEVYVEQNQLKEPPETARLWHGTSLYLSIYVYVRMKECVCLYISCVHIENSVQWE